MKNNSHQQLLPYAAAVFGNVCWGMSYLLTRIALRTTTPELLLSLRFVAAFAILNIILLTGREKLDFHGRKLLPLILLGAAELMCFYFESYGVMYTNATFSGIILSVVPVVALIFGAVFLKEYPTKKQTVFCFLPIIGVILMTLSGSSIGVITPVGVIFLICACLSYATYRTVNRFASANFTPFERTYAVLAACTVVFTAAALIEVRGDIHAYLAPLHHIEFLIPMLILCIFCSIGANMLVNYAASKLSVLELSTVGTVSTVISMFAGVVFLGEPLTSMMAFGAVLIFIGIRQVTKPQKT